MALGQAFYFLISTLFSLLTYALTVRLLLVYFSSNPYNKISVEIGRLVEPIMTPLRPFLKTVYRIDLALLLIIYCCHLCRIFFFSILIGFSLQFSSLLAPIFSILQQAINIVFFSLLGSVILSWINPIGPNPLTDAMFYLSDWILQFIRKAIPPLGGIDLSPMFAMIGLQFISIAFINPFVV